MNSERFLTRVNNYPPLFHYTHQHTIMEILESKSLLSRPTWDFNDTKEYVHGLQLILKKFKHTRQRPEELDQLKPHARSILHSFCSPLNSLLDQIIAHIEYEIDNTQEPKVKVYVSCFSQSIDSKMVKTYGSVLIKFSRLLPVITYAAPRPFTASMLSRVSYNDSEFSGHVLNMGISLPLEGLLEAMDVKSILQALSPEQRLDGMAKFITENLCMFAPNIKRPKYSYEYEWRLKSIISDFDSEDIFVESTPDQRQPFELPMEAVPTNQTPARYLRELSLKGKFMSEDIFLIGTVGPSIPSKIGLWQFANSVGRINIQDIAQELADMEME